MTSAQPMLASSNNSTIDKWFWFYPQSLLRWSFSTSARLTFGANESLFRSPSWAWLDNWLPLWPFHTRCQLHPLIFPKSWPSKTKTSPTLPNLPWEAKHPMVKNTVLAVPCCKAGPRVTCYPQDFKFLLTMTHDTCKCVRILHLSNVHMYSRSLHLLRAGQRTHSDLLSSNALFSVFFLKKTQKLNWFCDLLSGHNLQVEKCWSCQFCFTRGQRNVLTLQSLTGSTTPHRVSGVSQEDPGRWSGHQAGQHCMQCRPSQDCKLKMDISLE
jgi:hypothetical protein